jgi:hypothetical protein
MSLLTNPHVNTFVYEFGLDGFDENSRFDLEMFIDMIDLLFTDIEYTKTRELIAAKKAAIAVRDQYESLGYELPNNFVISHNGIRIFEGVAAAE